jgi:hypothetical protein
LSQLARVRHDYTLHVLYRHCLDILGALALDMRASLILRAVAPLRQKHEIARGRSELARLRLGSLKTQRLQLSEKARDLRSSFDVSFAAVEFGLS